MMISKAVVLAHPDDNGRRSSCRVAGHREDEGAYGASPADECEGGDCGVRSVGGGASKGTGEAGGCSAAPPPVAVEGGEATRADAESASVPGDIDQRTPTSSPVRDDTRSSSSIGHQSQSRGSVDMTEMTWLRRRTQSAATTTTHSSPPSQPGAVHVAGITSLRRQTAVGPTTADAEGQQQAPSAPGDGHPDAEAANVAPEETIVSTADTATIAHARLVTEPPVYVASEVKEQFCSMTMCGRRTSLLWVGLACLALGALAVGLAVGLGFTRRSEPQQQQSSQQPPLLSDDNAPDGWPLAPTSPTQAPTTRAVVDPRAEAIARLIVQNVSGTVALDPSTPQNRALRWIVDVDPLRRNASSPFLIQRYALIVIFYSLGGEAWIDGTGYETGVDECSGKDDGAGWFGVVCDAETGYVTSLDVGENNLVGSAGIPPEVSSLRHLSLLRMSRNAVRGKIPTDIGRLTELVFLDLNKNVLTGSLPTEIGNLDNLNMLGLSDNKLRGPIPTPQFGHLTQLHHLYLREFNLNGTFPEVLLGMPSLRTLDLYRTNLRGTIPTEIGSLAQITNLNLGWNQLTSSVPTELGRLDLLKTLALFHNSLTGTIPSLLGQLDQLVKLLLHQNNFVGFVPDSMCDAASNIETLSADCKGPGEEVQCSCCTCCNDSIKVAMLGQLC